MKRVIYYLDHSCPSITDSGGTEQNDGSVTAAQARALGIADSVLARLTQRGKLERVARGVYRIPYFPAGHPDHFFSG